MRTDPGRKHLWILKLMGKILMTNRIFTVSKYLPIKYLLNTKRKAVNYSVKEPGRHCLPE